MHRCLWGRRCSGYSSTARAPPPCSSSTSSRCRTSPYPPWERHFSVHVFLQSKHGAIDDGQCGPRNQPSVTRERLQPYPAVVSGAQLAVSAGVVMLMQFKMATVAFTVAVWPHDTSFLSILSLVFCILFGCIRTCCIRTPPNEEARGRLSSE
jgi:hypothetical protein